MALLKTKVPSASLRCKAMAFTMKRNWAQFCLNNFALFGKIGSNAFQNFVEIGLCQSVAAGDIAFNSFANGGSPPWRFFFKLEGA